MSKMLVKRKCGCERECCSLCARPTLQWRHRCYRHGGQGLLLVAYNTYTVCDRCATRARRGEEKA